MLLGLVKIKELLNIIGEYYNHYNPRDSSDMTFEMAKKLYGRANAY